MQIALGILSSGNANVASVAAEIGYESEAAFSRAFKKMVGVPPSIWRRRAGPGMSRSNFVAVSSPPHMRSTPDREKPLVGEFKQADREFLGAMPGAPKEDAMKLEGGCYCGNLRYVSEGEPALKAQCHCRECQYISGGSPNLFLLMPADGFSYTKGSPKRFTRSDLERAVTREFCAECGTHITTRDLRATAKTMMRVSR